MTNLPLYAGSNISKVKAHNLSAVLSILRQREPVSRVRLAELTGLSTTTISNLISELLDQGILVEDGLQKPSRPRVGRPRTSLRLVPDARYAAGVHVGVGSIRVAVTDLCARPLASLSFAHPLEQPPEEVLAHAARLVRDVVELAGIDCTRIVGVGVGASGLVNPRTGVNVVAPNLGWHNVPVRDWLSRDLALPVCVDNNARAMALGEALFGAGKGVHALAFVYARVGVGAGLVVGEQLFRGSAAGAGEIGHITIVPDGGEPCRCGNTGCLETLVSEPVIVRLAQQLAGSAPEGILAESLRTGQGSEIDRVLAAARAGDEATRAMLEERACFLGIALANLVNVLNPDLIVLGGLCAQGQDLLLPTIERVMRQRAFAGLGDQVRVETTRFGSQAGVIGAAALALDAFFYQPPEVTT
ncbi:MAG TPA: ROK family protein [Anaerolineae bacterium]|nr:ROK family protein [Anaerolineae bacterium]